jgi:hypothetical protein
MNGGTVVSRAWQNQRGIAVSNLRSRSLLQGRSLSYTNQLVPWNRIPVYHSTRIKSLGGDSGVEPKEEQSSDGVDSGVVRSQDKISETLADLDALLGIEEEKEEVPVENNKASIEFSPSVLEAIAEAEKARAEARGGEEGLPKNVNDSIGRIVEQARKLSKENGETGTAGEEAMRQEFEQLLTVLTSPRGIDPEEIAEMKEKVFGTQTFFVTEILPVVEFDQGILVRGNFRGDMTEKFGQVCDKVKDLYGMCLLAFFILYVELLCFYYSVLYYT